MFEIKYNRMETQRNQQTFIKHEEIITQSCFSLFLKDFQVSLEVKGFRKAVAKGSVGSKSNCKDAVESSMRGSPLEPTGEHHGCA